MARIGMAYIVMASRCGRCSRPSYPVHTHACVRACTRACVRACVRACARARECARTRSAVGSTALQLWQSVHNCGNPRLQDRGHTGHNCVGHGFMLVRSQGLTCIGHSCAGHNYILLGLQARCRITPGSTTSGGAVLRYSAPGTLTRCSTAVQCCAAALRPERPQLLKRGAF